MSNKVIRLDTLKKNVYDIYKYDPDYMFNLKAFVNYAIKLYNSNILEDFPNRQLYLHYHFCFRNHNYI